MWWIFVSLSVRELFTMTTHTKRIFRFFYRHIKQYKLILFLMIVTVICAPIMSILVMYHYKLFFDVIVTQQDNPEIVSLLMKIILTILGINMVQSVLWRTAGFLNDYFQPRVMTNIVNGCFDYLHGHSYDFFNNNFSGALVKKVNRLSRAFESIADKIYWNLLPLVVVVVSILVVLFKTHPVLGAALSAWIAVFIVTNYLFSLYKLKFDIESSKAETKVSAMLADTITNAVTIKLFTSLPFELKRFVELTEVWFRKMKKSWDMSNYYEMIQAGFIMGIEFLMMYFGIRFWREGMITVGDFVLIQAFLLELFGKLWDFGRIIRDIYENLADAEEMIVILHTPYGIQDKIRPKRLVVKRGTIEFENVSFEYNEEQGVIRNFSLLIRSGEKVALIGPSGGGKSTIAKLIFRFFDIQKGKIVIDGVDIKTVSQKSLRESISLVPQDPVLFHRSLMENIRYGSQGASDQEVLVASHLARCDEFIQKLPQKYATYVGERGVKLSGGQRQRVAIARAILKNAPILILDEATSSLDSHSEILIQEALENLMKQKTTIVIAHRLSTIMKMDRIVVLQNGEIVESGSHGELLKREEGLYKKLWELQVGGYVES